MPAGIKLSGKKLPICDFPSASQEYFRSVFAANYLLTRGIMLPPTCPRRIVGPTGFASGSKQRMEFATEGSKKGDRDDWKGDEAMFMVWSAFEILRNQVQNLICIAEFDYNQDMRNFLSKFGIELNDVEGNYAADFLMIHPEKGIFIVEVKSAEDYSTGCQNYLKGKNSSLIKMQNMAEGLKKILSTAAKIQMKIRKIVAFPNCEMIKQIQTDTFDDKTDKTDYICFDALAAQDPKNWWDNLSNAPEASKDFFEPTASMLLALRCKLQAIGEGKNRQILEMVDEKEHREAKIQSLDQQKFLEKNERFQSKNLSSQAATNLQNRVLVLGKPQSMNADALGIVNVLEKPFTSAELIAKLKEMKTNEKSSKKAEEMKSSKLHVISEQFYFLTPEQLAVFEAGPLQVIEGPPGSGKSIMLQYQAYNLVENGQKVCIVASSPMTAEYRNFFDEKYGKSDETVKIYDYSLFFTLWDTMREKVVKKLNEFHIFFDDFFNDWVTMKPENVEELLETLVKNRNANEKKNFYCWIACDSHQIDANNNFRASQLKTILKLKNEQNFQHQNLRCVMRCASNIAQLFFKQWVPLIPENKDPICIGNNEVGKLVKNLRIDKSQITDRIIELVNTLKLHEGYEAAEIAIIETCNVKSFLNTENMEEIGRETGFGIHLLRSTGERLPECWANTIKLDHSRMTYSLQWSCVIVLIDEETAEAEPSTISQLKYVAYSRAMYALYCITVRKPIESLI